MKTIAQTLVLAIVMFSSTLLSAQNTNIPENEIDPNLIATEEEPTTRSIWWSLGISAGGWSYSEPYLNNENNNYSDESGVLAGLEIEVIFSFNKYVGLGAYTNLMAGVHTYNIEGSTGSPINQRSFQNELNRSGGGILLGPELKISFNNEMAILFSSGGGHAFNHNWSYVRTGFKFPSPLTMNLNILFNDEGAGILFGLGYSFGGQQQ